MVFSNYRELVRAADAEKWFAITPDMVEKQKAESRTQKGEAGNIVPLDVGAAA